MFFPYVFFRKQMNMQTNIRKAYRRVFSPGTFSKIEWQVPLLCEVTAGALVHLPEKKIDRL